MAAQRPGAQQEVASLHERKQASVPARLGAGVVVGAGCWLLTVAYLIVQPVVAAAWQPPYDVTANTISDLGVTGCGDFRQLDDRVRATAEGRLPRRRAVDHRAVQQLQQR